MKKIKDLASHALLMVKRELRSYFLLSVTIFLSFTFLLAFFLFSDSQIYNKYKEIFRVPPTIGIASNSFTINPMTGQIIERGTFQTTLKQNMLIEQLDKMENTQYFQYFSADAQTRYYSDEKNSVGIQMIFLPKEFPGFYTGSVNNFRYVEVIFGENRLNSHYEILIDELFYELLSLEQKSDFSSIILPLTDKEGDTELVEFKVVGIVSNGAGTDTITNESGHNSFYVSAYLSSDLLSMYDMDHLEKKILINSEKIEEVILLGDDLNLPIASSYTLHMRANEEIRNRILLNGIAAVLLFTLLGINLYSSFNNVLKERRYEVGVKRALGAGGKDIIIQFFLEGMIVMMANVFTAIIVVINAAVAFKFIQKFFYYNQWIIYVSMQSIILFLVCVTFLSVFFSLVFAYQSTRVEIVKHLKSE